MTPVKTTFVQLLGAVEYCHAQGIFHRDLRPENVVCSADRSRLYLTDFGLATDNSISTDTGTSSSVYMRPGTRALPLPARPRS
jgi:serine/threonine protein kinase